MPRLIITILRMVIPLVVEKIFVAAIDYAKKPKDKPTETKENQKN